MFLVPETSINLKISLFSKFYTNFIIYLIFFNVGNSIQVQGLSVKIVCNKSKFVFQTYIYIYCCHVSFN